MTREELFQYVQDQYGTVPDYPWERDNESAVLRHNNTNKWYGLAMLVGADKLGYDNDDRLSVLNIKAEPLLIDMLVTKDGYHRAYHMNKTQWLTIELEAGITDDEIKDLLDRSYELTDKNWKKS